MPLLRAAERLGVSLSGLKYACRRLCLACCPRGGWRTADPEPALPQARQARTYAR